MNRTEIIDGLPFEDYAAAPGVHKSMLDEFVRCPLAGYEYMMSGGHAPTKAMILGSAVDTLVCEPDKFNSRFWIRPETYDADGEEKPWNGNSKVCKAWMASHRNRPVLTVADMTEAKGIVAAIQADTKAKRLLEGCRAQVSLFWTDPLTGLQMKGRPDLVNAAGEYAVDLKVIRDASEYSAAKAIAEYRYHIQAAIYSDGLEANGVKCKRFYFLFVESGDRPKPNVRRLKDEAVTLGRETYRGELTEVKKCFDTGNWPGFSGGGADVLEIDLPAYVYAKATETMTLKIKGNEYAL